MKWYDIFSNFYDSSLEKLYQSSRKKAVEMLDLKDGQSVLDLACGTGANFPHIRETGKNIVLYATDFSDGMLKKAQERIDKNGWDKIHLFIADARNLDRNSILNHTRYHHSFDRIVCVLGLSVIPDWEKVLTNLLALLNDHGRLVIVDVFAEKRNFNTWLVEKIARADLDRPIWQTLEQMTDQFSIEYMPVKESRVGGKLFVASGTKRKQTG